MIAIGKGCGRRLETEIERGFGRRSLKVLEQEFEKRHRVKGLGRGFGLSPGERLETVPW